MKEFDIEKFDIIQDEENYYFFRALNLADIDDLEKQIVGQNGVYDRIRTDRERWEENRELEPPRYKENAKVSLEQMHDHIKIHYRKDTNCISLSSNANISICYARGSYRNKYVLIRVPKKEFGNNIYNAGSYMLDEIEKKVQMAIRELEKVGETEILSKLSEIDNAASSADIADIVTGVYRLSSETEKIYRGKKVSTDRLQAISKRFKRYSSLNDNQVLEKNRLIGKLTVLEYYNKISPIIPYTRTNSQILGSLGNAFSSSEIIHYGDISGDKIINISSRLIDMLAILQQLREKTIDEQEMLKIAKLENEIIGLAIKGYEFETDGEKTIFTNGENSIILERPEDILPFRQLTIEEGYKLTNGEIEYTEIANFLKKYYYISKSKLRASELARDLYEITGKNPEYEDIIRKLETSTYEVEPEIMDRSLENNYTISEAVGMFTTDIEEKMIADIESFDVDGLREIFSDREKASSQILKYFDSRRETQDINLYYAKALMNSYDWDRIGINFTKEQEELFVEKLSKNNLPEIYEKLKQTGVKEDEIRAVLLNLCINGRFKRILESEDFEKEVLENIKNLRKNISIEQVENYLGFYEIKGTAIVLKEYQQRAVDNLDKILENHRFASVILPTGAGKTFVEIAEILKDKYKGEKVLCLAPSNEILGQMQDYLVEYVIGKKGSLGKTNAEIVKEKFPNLDLWTYSSLKAKGTKELKNSQYGLIFLDELHRIGAEDWGRNADILLEAQKESTKIVGITATPERDREVDPHKRQKRNMADELALKLGYTEDEVREGKHIAIKMDLIDAIRNGIIVNLRTVSCEYTLQFNSRFTGILDEINQIEDETARLRTLKKYSSLRNDINNAIGIPEILQTNLKKGGRYIVFMPISSDLYGPEGKGENKLSVEFRYQKIKEKFEEWLGSENLEFYSMFGTYSNKRNSEELHGFEDSKTDNIKLMLVINKLNEGVHVKGINGIIWLRSLDRNSSILLQQQMGRCIIAVDENNPISEDDIPIIIDFPNNLMMVNLYSEVNNYTKLDDLEMLRDIKDWIEYHNGYMPDIYSTSKEEVRKAISLKRIQAKYMKYVYDCFDVLEESDKKKVDEIVALGEEIDLWNIILPDRVDETGKKIPIEELTNIDIFQLTGKLRLLTELESEVKRERARAGVVENVLKVARVLHKYGVDLSKVQTSRRDENNKNYYFKLSEIVQPGIDIDRIIEENGLDPNFEFGIGIRKVRDAYNGTSNLRITQEARQEVEKLAIVNLDPDKSVIAKTLKVARVLHKNGVDLSKVTLSRSFFGKTRTIYLDEIAQEGIDINRIIIENGLDPKFEYGAGVTVLRATYNGTRNNRITESERREAENLKLVKTERHKTVVARTLEVARALKANGVDFDKIDLGAKQDGKFHYFLLSELDKQGIDIDQIIQEYNLKPDFEFGRNFTKLRRAYRGTGTSAITEDEKREAEELGIIRKEAYREIVDWLETHNGQMPRGSLGRDGKIIVKREEMTPEEQNEINLYVRWRESKVRKILYDSIGVPLEEITEEYREQIKYLREKGFGIPKKTLGEEMVEWLEEHNAQMPRAVIYSNGVKLKVQEMTPEEQRESKLRGRWKNSKELRILNEYAGRPIEEVPTEYRSIITKLRELGQKGTTPKDSKILNQMRQAVVENIGTNGKVRSELKNGLQQETYHGEGEEPEEL